MLILTVSYGVSFDKSLCNPYLTQCFMLDLLSSFPAV